MADGAGAGAGAYQYGKVGGVSRKDGSGHRDPPRPNKYVPNKDCFWVGPRGDTKSSFIQMLLLWKTFVMCLRCLFTEVIVIAVQLEPGLNVKDSSNWCYFRWLHQIDDDTNESPDGFFRVFTEMDDEIYIAEIKARQIDGLRLIIGDDWYADAHTLQKFLKYVDGGQKHPGIMTNLSHRAIVRQERDEEGNKVTVYKGGASAHLWLITQKVTRMTGTTTRTLMKANVIAHTHEERGEERNLR